MSVNLKSLKLAPVLRSDVADRFVAAAADPRRERFSSGVPALCTLAAAAAAAVPTEDKHIQIYPLFGSFIWRFLYCKKL
jgi:hypothetical protein